MASVTAQTSLPAAGNRRRTKRRGRTLRIKLIALAIIVGCWEAGVALFGQDYMATPTGVVAAVPDVLLHDDAFWSSARETLSLVGVGLVVAIVVGGLLGLAMGRLPLLEAAIAPYVNGSYATPMIAVLPILTLWLGFNSDATFALIVFAALPPMAVGAWDGSRAVSARYLEVATAFGARRRDVWLGIAVPSSLPYLLAGFRLASGRALSAVVIAEFLIGTGGGLGIHVMNLAGQFRHNEAFVGIMVIAVIGLLLSVGIDRLVATLLPWFRKT
jgi:ABC-type nitrate/sulfonate/bicarbonate transport system permease component